jgi:hypothetical protein
MGVQDIGRRNSNYINKMLFHFWKTFVALHDTDGRKRGNSCFTNYFSLHRSVKVSVRLYGAVCLKQHIRPHATLLNDFLVELNYWTWDSENQFTPKFTAFLVPLVFTTGVQRKTLTFGDKLHRILIVIHCIGRYCSCHLQGGYEFVGLPAPPITFVILH